MSKSLGNYIGINKPTDKIFGKLMSISDELMLRYYELLSDMPQIAELEKLKNGIKSGALSPYGSRKAAGQGNGCPLPRQ